MNNNNIYEGILEEARNDENILGLILAGSRARNRANENSDWDVYIIFDNSVTEELINEYQTKYHEKYNDFKLDISNKALMTLSDFSCYADIDTDYFWDRYNLVHAKIEIDKTSGEIERRLGAINSLSEVEQKKIIDRNLGDYISLVYRSMKSNDTGNSNTSILDASESTKYMLTSLFALHSRIRPFNKYLEWELTNYPLEGFALESQKFVDMILQIIKNADPKTQQSVYIEIEKLARAKGYGYIYDAWGEKIKYINNKNF